MPAGCFSQALARVLGEASRQVTAVMCAETLWWRCSGASSRMPPRSSSVPTCGTSALTGDCRLTEGVRGDERGSIVYDAAQPSPGSPGQPRSAEAEAPPCHLLLRQVKPDPPRRSGRRACRGPPAGTPGAGPASGGRPRKEHWPARHGHPECRACNRRVPAVHGDGRAVTGLGLLDHQPRVIQLRGMGYPASTARSSSARRCRPAGVPGFWVKGRTVLAGINVSIRDVTGAIRALVSSGRLAGTAKLADVDAALTEACSMRPARAGPSAGEPA